MKMITLSEAMEAANYHVCGGETYGWSCFGPNARYLDFYSEPDRYMSVVYDTETQEVYCAQVSDDTNNYMLINEDYRKEYEKEASSKALRPYIAYDDVEYTILSCGEDYLEKASAISNGEPYDTRVAIPMSLNKQEALNAMTIAHRMDITFNEYVAIAIENAIEQDWSDQE